MSVGCFLAPKCLGITTISLIYTSAAELHCTHSVRYGGSGPSRLSYTTAWHPKNVTAHCTNADFCWLLQLEVQIPNSTCKSTCNLRDKSLKVQTIDNKTETLYDASTCSFTFCVYLGCIKLHLLIGNLKFLCALGLPLRTVVLAQGSRDDSIAPDECDDPSLFIKKCDAPELGCSFVLTAAYIKLNPVALGHHLF